jgi:hypothetical protein
MLDCQVYGLKPGGHHLTNVLLHAANTLLLFFLLRRQFGIGLWNSGFVAALFAIHPLHVESVAWISERKDVLSGFFFLLTLWAYAAYARREFSLGRYLLVTVFLTLGLMAKPMLVTAPFVLLLLDYWPLRRATGWPRLLLEKLPWLALSAADCAMTFFAQRRSGAVMPLEICPMRWRIANAIVAYAGYLVQFFWPLNLAAMYPHPFETLAIWKIVAASGLLVAVTVCAVV